MCISCLRSLFCCERTTPIIQPPSQQYTTITVSTRSAANSPDPLASSVRRINSLALTLMPTVAPRVLIAEDSAPNMKMIRFLFEKECMTLGMLKPVISPAISGEEAQKLASENDYDLIITDRNMPPPDGIELIQIIRGSASRPERHAAERNAKVPIISWTTLNSPVEVDEMRLAGATDSLPKPISRLAISEIAKKYLGNFLPITNNTEL